MSLTLLECLTPRGRWSTRNQGDTLSDETPVSSSMMVSGSPRQTLTHTSDPQSSQSATDSFCRVDKMSYFNDIITCLDYAISKNTIIIHLEPEIIYYRGPVLSFEQ